MQIYPVDDNWCFYADGNVPDGCIGHQCETPIHYSHKQNDYFCLCDKKQRILKECTNYIEKRETFYSYPIYSIEGREIRLLKTTCPNCNLKIPDKILMMVKMLL